MFVYTIKDVVGLSILALIISIFAVWVVVLLIKDFIRKVKEPICQMIGIDMYYDINKLPYRVNFEQEIGCVYGDRFDDLCFGYEYKKADGNESCFYCGNKLDSKKALFLKAKLSGRIEDLYMCNHCVNILVREKN